MELKYDAVINKILQIEETNIQKGYWVNKNAIPLLMRRMYYKYENGVVPLEDTFAYPIHKNIPVHMIIVGKTGRQKTVMLKNIVRGFYKAGYKILIIEPKKMDWIYGREKGKGIRLAYQDYNEKEGLDFVSYTPITHFEHAKETLNETDFKKTTFFTIDIKSLTSKEMWMSFGAPFKGAEIIVDCINKGIYSINEIKEGITSSKIMYSTKNITLQVLENYEKILYNKKYKPLPLEQLWDDHKLVVINFHGKQGADMNTIIGLVVNLAKRIGQKEKVVTKKLLVFDDIFMYGGAMAYNFAKTPVNYAQNEIANCQYNYRSFGIDSIVVTQNLDQASIHPTVVEGRDEFLITRTGGSEILRNLIPSQAYFLAINQNEAKGRTLISNKVDRYFEWVYCKEDSLEFVGFPFDCGLGHPKDPTVI